MRFEASTTRGLPGPGIAAAAVPALLLAPNGARLAGFSFWLTVMLAAIAMVLSALCIADPALRPKDDPYYFIGQWFLWLATPLLWGIVAASRAFAWLKPLDLVAVLIALAISRVGAHAICGVQWRAGCRRHSDFQMVLRSTPRFGR
jgi:hypothetical protein